MKKPPKRQALVKSLLAGKEHLRNGLVLEPCADAPLDRVWVHWPGDGGTVWAEKIADLALERSEIEVNITPPKSPDPIVRYVPIEGPLRESPYGP